MANGIVALTLFCETSSFTGTASCVQLWFNLSILDLFSNKHYKDSSITNFTVSNHAIVQCNIVIRGLTLQ